MVRLSFGPQGEFFIESNEALTSESVDLAEVLYRKIMEARSDCDLLHEAKRAMNGLDENDCQDGEDG